VGRPRAYSALTNPFPPPAPPPPYAPLPAPPPPRAPPRPPPQMASRDAPQFCMLVLSHTLKANLRGMQLVKLMEAM
jgi:hypothetical protein